MINASIENGNRSQVQVGSTPKARAKTSTATMFMPRLKKLVSTIDIGITRRGNWVLRTIPSWATTAVVAPIVASWKNEKSTMLSSRKTS